MISLQNQLIVITLDFVNNLIKSQLWGLLPIESTYLPCLIKAYSVRGGTTVAYCATRSLEGT